MGSGARKHTARMREPIRADLAWLTTACPTNLPAFGRRGDARKMARCSKDRHARALACPYCPYFHVGRLPDLVRRGEAPRSDATAGIGVARTNDSTREEGSCSST